MAMQTFKVVRESEGWAVHVGDAMTMPFWSRDRAVQEANWLCETLRSHGVAAEVVIIETNEPTAPPGAAESFSGARLAAWLRNARPDRK